LHQTVPPGQIVFRSGDVHAQCNAILAGAGIGFTSVLQAAALPGLVQVMPPRSDWAAPLWLVTHMDLHRTTKVQALLSFLKAQAREWHHD
jgi:DNA-binding transcriptional LysR family regulator